VKVCEYLVKTPIENIKRIGIALDDGKILDPNLVWRGDFEREGFLSCKEKADRIVPSNLKELLTFSDDPIDAICDSYGLYLFLQKVGMDQTFEGFSFIKEESDEIKIPVLEEIPWTTDVNKLEVEVGLALMACGEGTNLDDEKAREHFFALNLYQKFGDLTTYGKYWITADDFQDLKALKLDIFKNEKLLEAIVLNGYLQDLSESLSAHSKKDWIGPGDIFYLKSSQKIVETSPGDTLEVKVADIFNLKNKLGTPIVGKPWEI